MTNLFLYFKKGTLICFLSILIIGAGCATSTICPISPENRKLLEAQEKASDQPQKKSGGSESNKREKFW